MLIQVYAPTSASTEEELEEFYETLQKEIDSKKRQDILIISRDFNAKVGRKRNKEENGTVGNAGLGERNERGEILSAVQLEKGTTEWFLVTKGVRQGCILSPHLFSLYAEGIMREVEYDPRSGEYDEPRMQALSIRDLRYADDTALLATTTLGLKIL